MRKYDTKKRQASPEALEATIDRIEAQLMAERGLDSSESLQKDYILFPEQQPDIEQRKLVDK